MADIRASWPARNSPEPNMELRNGGHMCHGRHRVADLATQPAEKQIHDDELARRHQRAKAHWRQKKQQSTHSLQREGMSADMVQLCQNVGELVRMNPAIARYAVNEAPDHNNTMSWPDRRKGKQAHRQLAALLSPDNSFRQKLHARSFDNSPISSPEGSFIRRRSTHQNSAPMWMKHSITMPCSINEMDSPVDSQQESRCPLMSGKDTPAIRRTQSNSAPLEPTDTVSTSSQRRSSGKSNQSWNCPSTKEDSTCVLGVPITSLGLQHAEIESKIGLHKSSRGILVSSGGLCNFDMWLALYALVLLAITGMHIMFTSPLKYL